MRRAAQPTSFCGRGVSNLPLTASPRIDSCSSNLFFIHPKQERRSRFSIPCWALSKLSFLLLCLLRVSKPCFPCLHEHGFEMWSRRNTTRCWKDVPSKLTVRDFHEFSYKHCLWKNSLRSFTLRPGSRHFQNSTPTALFISGVIWKEARIGIWSVALVR